MERNRKQNVILVVKNKSGRSQSSSGFYFSLRCAFMGASPTFTGGGTLFGRVSDVYGRGRAVYGRESEIYGRCHAVYERVSDVNGRAHDIYGRSRTIYKNMLNIYSYTHCNNSNNRQPTVDGSRVGHNNHRT